MKRKELTIEEKIKLLVAKDFWSNDSCDGKVYSFIVSDGPVGLRHPFNLQTTENTIPSISYPAIQTLSHTWNLELVRLMGNALANDCIEQNVDILLAPGINLKRVPINGRNFEYFSEDPFLSGVMGREYINGVQEKHVGTSLKHYCANNLEYSRLWISSEVDERTLREMYLRQFEIVCEANPLTVMSSYNLVNGVRMSEHKKLYDLLRNEFKFKGLIMSDWDAVKNRLESLKAGLDIEMPYNKANLESLYEAYKQGELPLDKVEESAGRIIELANKCEENKKYQKVDMTVNERENVSLRVAEEGIVLLKNDNNLLPLKGKEKIFITGAPLIWRYFGGGSSNVTTRYPYKNLKSSLEEVMNDVNYFETVQSSHGHQSNIGNLKGGVKVARTCDVSIVCVGNNDVCESEAHDREHIKLSSVEESAIISVANASKKTIVIVYAGSAVDMTNWIDKVDVVIFAGYGGEYINDALANVIIGKVNPSGKLTETFPLDLYDVPAMNTYRDESVVMYTEGLNVGYRYFDTFNKPVLYPFGYGLSYSSFKYSNLVITKNDSKYKVSFDIENTSNIDGHEIAQVYIRELDKNVYRPNKELKGFKKVFVKKNSKSQVEIILNKDAFSYYSTSIDSWKVDSGLFEIQVCSNVKTIELSETINVNVDKKGNIQI